MTLVDRWRTASVSGLTLVVAIGLGVGLAAPSLSVATTKTGAATAPSLHNKCQRSSIDVPSCGVLWGLYAPGVSSHGHYAPQYAKFERGMHRRLDIVKTYVDWQPGVTFPNETFRKLAGNGKRIVYVSWNAINYDTHRKVSYQSIADGDWDKSVILPEADRLKSFHHKIFLDFNHEFDAHAQDGKGTPAQYVQAYRHIYRVLRGAGVHNVIWSWVSTGTMNNTPYIKASWPGGKYVDWVGYDPYNFAFCTGHEFRSPYVTFQPFYHWLQHQPAMKHKPILLGEYGSAITRHIEEWYTSLAGTLKRMPRIKALFQWSAPTVENCDVALSDSPAAMRGFAKAGHSPYVTGAHH